MGQPTPARLLVVDDEQGMREFLTICLTRAGYQCVAVGSGAEAIRLISDRQFDLVITDLTMPGIGGMEVLRHACSLPSPPMVIMITAFGTTDTAIEAMKIGAYDYLTKPFKVDEITVVVRRAVERRDLASENLRLREELRGVQSLDKMVGRSDDMLRVFELIRKVAPTRTNVLVRGESGTGKELVARALHNLSDRAAGPFVAVNCGAIPETLMESELFGHVKGAFTGANTAREGVFVASKRGTLFLDEIGELSLAMQVKLLRALQERKIRPVGGDREVELDCRIVAATNRDLEAAIEAGGVSAGPLLPARRRPDRPASAAPPHRGHSAVGRAFLRADQCRDAARPDGGRSRSDGLVFCATSIRATSASSRTSSSAPSPWRRVLPYPPRTFLRSNRGPTCAAPGSRSATTGSTSTSRWPTSNAA